MIQNQTNIIEQHLQQISDMLILNGTVVACPGLIHGKIGLAIFFFNYARFTGIELYEDYASLFAVSSNGSFVDQ